MSGDPGPDEGFGVEAEEDESPFAQVGDWVLLAHIPDRAVRIYCLLRAHVNHVRGDDEVWPSQEKLAAVLGLSKPDDVGKAIKTLEGIGALRKKYRTGPKGRYTVYVMRLHAPPGYRGMRSASVDLHRKGAVERLVEERVKRLPHRTQAGRDEAASDGYTPDLGSPVQTTPNQGATPDPGVEAPPNQGCKPYEGEPEEPTTTRSRASRERKLPVPGRASAASAPAEAGSEMALIPPPPGTVATPTTTGRDVATAWVDAYRTSVGAEPTRHQIGQVAREAKALLEAGNPPNRVLYAARSIAARGKAHVTAEYADLSAAAKGRSTARPAPARPSTTDQRVSAGLALAARYAAEEARQ